ncbi:MAG: hypothetical protein A3E87_07865 [Gammaproteobacteria bacterium RIFCSPHIGHO2_12_FULL_35_23]|nr:MAG: hypothetical protein A3E87_07865 [Gammaproteobacteria bacterium RIFCSPHIGHO2_12_FULL_35_23]
MLIVTWFAIIAFCVVMYIILDGFTLGTGIVMPWMKIEERDIAMSVILPTWDGNQTWLVLGGASLYGAFPLAFSTLLPAFYLPLILMVTALLFRGVCFEFRLKAKQGRKNWDLLFTLSSILIAFLQGLVLGAYVQGVNPGSITNHPYLWLTPFSVMTGFAVIFGYSLLGSTRLVLKTVGSLHDKMRAYAIWASFFVMLFMLVVSVWMPHIVPVIYARWFASSNLYYLMVFPLIAGLAYLGLWFSLAKNNDYTPYWCVVIIFLMGYFGLGYSMWPYILPYQVTAWQAAAPDNTLKFILVGAGIMIPVLLIYTGYSYRIFRGKVREAISDY